MAVDVIGNGNEDGTNFGRSADKLGFFGLTTPIVKPALTAAVTTVGVTNVSAYGFGTAAQANHVIELLNLIRTRLLALGLMS